MMLRRLDRIAWALALAGAAVALLVGLMTTTSVAGRALFKAPIQGDVELTQLGVALAISLCLPWCQLRGANIIVDFFTQRATKLTQRRLDAIGALLIAAMYLLLAWRTTVGAVSTAGRPSSSWWRSTWVSITEAVASPATDVASIKRVMARP